MLVSIEKTGMLPTDIETNTRQEQLMVVVNMT
jgi:hypothetical protein